MAIGDEAVLVSAEEAWDPSAAEQQRTKQPRTGDAAGAALSGASVGGGGGGGAPAFTRVQSVSASSGVPLGVGGAGGTPAGSSAATGVSGTTSAQEEQSSPAPPPVQPQPSGGGGVLPQHLWLVAARPSTTFKELLDVVVGKCVHRVYVTDDAGLPLGVVTLTDIVQLVAVDPEFGADEEVALLGEPF